LIVDCREGLGFEFAALDDQPWNFDTWQYIIAASPQKLQPTVRDGAMTMW